MTTWLTRATLAEISASGRAQSGMAASGMPLSGWAHVSSPGVVLGSTPAEMELLRAVSAATLRAAGVGASDRVLVALASDGVLAGPLVASAAVALGATAASVSPRGRTRVIHALQSLGATTLIATPCGASDLLARIFIEFGLQPEDLGLRRILVGGEIPSPGTLHQLGDEFDCDVRRVMLDPFTGAALAQGLDQFEPADADGVARAVLDRDELAPTDAAGASELVVRGIDDDTWLRTGEVVVGSASAGALPVTTQTVGDHVLARGRWLSLPAIDRALASIDGIARWQLEVSREGTLDRVAVIVALDRPSLVDDPMWAGRIKEAVASVVPVRVETRTVGMEGTGTEETGGADDRAASAQPIIDHRGHHAGVDRAAAARAVAVTPS